MQWKILFILEVQHLSSIFHIGSRSTNQFNDSAQKFHNHSWSIYKYSSIPYNQICSIKNTEVYMATQASSS
jgi:hypothetical protein